MTSNSSISKILFTSKSEEDTKRFLKEVVLPAFTDCNNQHILTLHGNLGTGKTFISSFLIQNLLQNPSKIVTSPTFPILNTYNENGIIVNHFDLYRIKNYEELTEIGFTELISENINIIEWPEIALEMIKPNQHLKQLHINYGKSEHERMLTFVKH
jgi:hypothetical protein